MSFKLPQILGFRREKYHCGMLYSTVRVVALCDINSTKTRCKDQVLTMVLNNRCCLQGRERAMMYCNQRAKN